MMNIPGRWVSGTLLRAGSLIASLALLGVSVVMAADSGVPETVRQVDLGRYAGTWHEIARLPNRFQKHCVGQVTARYQLKADGMVEVVNRCLTKDGGFDEAVGVARVLEGSGNAKLEVSFVSLFGWQLFWGDYWILGLGADYQYAVVGTPGRDYGWVLSRTPEMTPELRRQVDEILSAAGYETASFIASDR